MKLFLTRLFVTLLVVGLGAAVVLLLSQQNARTFALRMHDGHLVVMKGRMLPAGVHPYQPVDSPAAETYAPIPLEVGPPEELLERSFTEKEDLDRALFNVLADAARPLVGSDDAKLIEKGLGYVRRAQRLSHLTDDQRRALTTMEADVAYQLARLRLEDARALLADALSQLKVAADAQNRHAVAAQHMQRVIEPAAKELSEAIRDALSARQSNGPSPLLTPGAPSPAPPTRDEQSQ